jgi:hypothetical protein
MLCFEKLQLRSVWEMWVLFTTRTPRAATIGAFFNSSLSENKTIGEDLDIDPALRRFESAQSKNVAASSISWRFGSIHPTTRVDFFGLPPIRI